MNLPGFTAETSLQAHGHYRTIGGTAGGFANATGVVPQLPIGFCQANCDHISDDFLRTVCELNCFSGGGTGGGGGAGGGGSHLCTPRCGRCLPDPDSRTGRSKFCILRNCNDVQRAC